MRQDPLKLLIDAILKMVPKSKKPPPDQSRRMKFPYTFSAKIAHFPWLYYVSNNWMFRYYLLAFLLCTPVFMKITKAVHSPNNVAKWQRIKAKERDENEEHQWHLI